MKLFRSDRYFPVHLEATPQLLTPLGILTAGHAFPALKKTLRWKREAYRHSTGIATIHQWVSAQGILEHLQLQFIPENPPGMERPICQAVVMRLQASTPLFHVHPTLSWNPGYRWTDGSPESGEGLQAKTWTDDHWKVTVGTEDEEFLAARAKIGRWMPPRLSSFLTANLYKLIDMKDESLTICLPALEAGERAQVQFIIASGPHDHEDISTWFAADQSPDRLLRLADCE